MTKSRNPIEFIIERRHIAALAIISMALIPYGYPVVAKEIQTRANEKMKASAKESKLLKEIKSDSFERPQFVVFLRHFG